ncbi:MAG: hypothetical protein AB1772_08890 [Candidatus Zixiibacteriota bacterium]
MTRQLMSIAAVLFLPVAAWPYEPAGSIYGEMQGDQFGSAFCTVDFNDDGYQDLVIGAPASDANGTSSGKVYLYLGGPMADTVADLHFVGVASSFFGKALASAGDFNNDGAEDLLVGAPFYDQPANNAGAVYLYYGAAQVDSVVDHIFFGEADSDYFGIAVGSSDFNDDGVADIVVGAYKVDWGVFTDAGRAYVYYGSGSPDFVVDQVLQGEADGERFGFALTGGDFNGDGGDDIAVGAYSYDGANLNAGRIYLFYGGASADPIDDLIIEGPIAGEKYGWSLASGEVTGDDYDDIIMGTDGHVISGFSAGRMYVFDGGPGINSTPHFNYDLGRAAEDLLGFSVAAGVDVTADGIADLIAGMPGNNDRGLAAGGAILFAGGVAVSVDTTIYGDGAQEQAGQAVFLWPDYGSDQIAFGAGGHGYDSYRGRVVLFRGPAAADCCSGRVGDANGEGGDEPTIGDVTVMIDAKFISGTCAGIIPCLTEADVNQSGGTTTSCEDISIGDITILIDYLFITGPTLGLPECL